MSCTQPDDVEVCQRGDFVLGQHGLLQDGVPVSAVASQPAIGYEGRAVGLDLAAERHAGRMAGGAAHPCVPIQVHALNLTLLRQR